MSVFASLTDIKQKSVGEVLLGLRDKSPTISTEAGLTLTASARQFGLNIPDFLKLSIKKEDGLNGFEMALAELGLPLYNDFDNGVVLKAASDTFQTFPGTRAMFPAVIDNILQWAVRQDNFLSVAALVGNSRTMNGTELITTVVDDDSAQRDTFTIPEMGNIPTRSIQTSEVAVKMYKHGSGIRTSYEFQRRAALDILTPYAARIARQLELSKITEATNLLVNGDGVHGAAPVVTQSSFDTLAAVTSTHNVLSWPNLLAWLVSRAQAGAPIDTVVGNWDSAFRWARLWSVPTANASGVSDAENLAKVQAVYAMPGVQIPKFVVSPTAPATRLIGYTKAETLEELVEAGSQISETERVIRNQTVVYVKTETTGYRLVFGDTRSVFNYGA